MGNGFQVRRSGVHRWMIFLALCAGCAAGPREPSGVTLASFQTLIQSADKGAEEGGARAPDLDGDAAVEDFLAYAAIHNPGLKAAFERWAAAMKRIAQARALPDPRLSYGYFIQNVETRVGPQQHRFGVSQMFPWFGELNLRGDVAAREADVLRARYEEARNRLFYTVEKDFFEWVYLHRAISVTEENLKLLSAMERAAQAGLAVALTPYSGLSRIQVEMGKLEERLKSLRDLRGPLAARLNASLNRPSEAPLPEPANVAWRSPAFEDAEVLEALRRYNPELKALDHAVEKESAAVELARTDFYPEFTLGLEWVQTGEALNRAMPESGKDPIIASVSVNLPIWFGKYRAGVEEAALRREAARQARRDRENTLAADLKMALYAYRDAERKIDLYKNGLVLKARQTFEVSLKDLEVGLASFLEVMDAQRSLLEFQLAYERALVDRAQRLAEIEMLVGRRLETIRIDAGKMD